MRWMEEVEKVFNAKLLELRDAKVKFMSMEQWRVFVKDTNGCMKHGEHTFDTKQ